MALQGISELIKRVEALIREKQLGVELALQVSIELLEIGTCCRGVAQGDLHLEIVGTLVILFIFVENERADPLLPDEHIGGVRFGRHDADAGVAEQPLEIGVELPDFLNVHRSRPLASAVVVLEQMIHGTRRLETAGLADDPCRNAGHRGVVRYGFEHHRSGSASGGHAGG